MNKFRKIYININSTCNCKCVNCILKEESRENTALLQEDDIRMIIDKVKASYNDQFLNIVEISGGEPTLHPSFSEIIKLLYQAKQDNLFYKITLLTNAMTASDSNFCSEISKYLDDVVITLYDTDPESHDEFTRVTGSLNKKIVAIDNFLDSGVKVHIKLLVIKPSYQHLPQMAKFIAEKWGDRVHVTINGTHYTGDAYKNQDLLSFNYSKAIEYIEQALDILLDNHIVVSVFFPLCLLDPYYWSYSPHGYKEIIDKSISISPTYELGKANRLLDEFINRSVTCQDCLLLSRCNWPWKKYCEINGDKEIETAKERLYRDILINN